jgi:DHA1 family multidrug resistance protein-like MFS transporter
VEEEFCILPNLPFNVFCLFWVCHHISSPGGISEDIQCVPAGGESPAFHICAWLRECLFPLTIYLRSRNSSYGLHCSQGAGPMFFSPLSEVPRLGRNIPYFTSFFLFILVTIAAARVESFPGLIALRFVQGFLGGPVLATGGASASDMLGFQKIPYALASWLSAGYMGPALGPLLSGFAITNSTWRWSMYELLIVSGFTFMLLFLCLPETNPETILLQRARRLRRLTGDPNVLSQSEIKEGRRPLLVTMAWYLTTPLRITMQDPAVAFIGIYTALLYGIYVR